MVSAAPLKGTDPGPVPGRNKLQRPRPPGLIAWGFGLAGWLFLGASPAPGPARASADPPPVSLVITQGHFILDNGLLQARIEQRSGVLTSLRYNGEELLAQHSPGGALGGYWSWVGRLTPGPRRQPVVRIDPATNAGAMAEVATEYLQDPERPVASTEMSLRYTMLRGEPCLYLSAVWRHRAGDPPFSVGEGRYALKLNPDLFDFLSVDKARQRLMPAPADWDRGEPTNLKEARRLVTGRYAGTVEHKYDYAAPLYEIPAYGWSSTQKGIGLWIVQPSWESVAGGPTKVELTGHLDVNPGGTPTLLWMWLGSHYGGSSLVVGTNETWSKFIGPIALYCNHGGNPEQLWQDALARARVESGRWPYSWVLDSDYPPASERALVRGRIQLQDPELDLGRVGSLWVGLTAPDYPLPAPVGAGRRFGRAGSGTPDTNLTPPLFRSFPPMVDWQRDAKHYQFWVRARADGSFEIPHVRAGTWALRAFAEGVLGELVRTQIVVRAGTRLDLGTVVWQPERWGRTLWEIGVPDRTAREFRHGDHYWQWGLYLRYPEEFPHDVDFVIGRSDWRRDWNYVQPPRIRELAGVQLSEEHESPETADAGANPNTHPPARVEPTTWTIRFTMPGPVRGTAILRMAFCGAGPGCRIEVGVNGLPVGDTGFLPPTGTMHRDGITGYWTERRIRFDATLLRPGENRITLHLPAQTWTQGVLYDYLRLELVEEAGPPDGGPAPPGPR